MEKFERALVDARKKRTMLGENIIYFIILRCVSIILEAGTCIFRIFGGGKRQRAQATSNRVFPPPPSRWNCGNKSRIRFEFAPHFHRRSHEFRFITYKIVLFSKRRMERRMEFSERKEKSEKPAPPPVSPCPSPGEGQKEEISEGILDRSRWLDPQASANLSLSRLTPGFNERMDR